MSLRDAVNKFKASEVKMFEQTEKKTKKAADIVDMAVNAAFVLLSQSGLVSKYTEIPFTFGFDIDLPTQHGCCFGLLDY